MKTISNYLCALLLVPVLLLGGGCALWSSTFNPVAEAQTLEQKAYALYGTFVVYQENAAALMGSATVPDAVKRGIQTADSIAHPAAQILVITAREVASARRELNKAPGPSSVEKLDAAINALSNAFNLAKPKIDYLKLAVDHL